MRLWAHVRLGWCQAIISRELVNRFMSDLAIENKEQNAISYINLTKPPFGDTIKQKIVVNYIYENYLERLRSL